MLVLYLDDTATVFPRAFYQRVQSSWHTCGVVLRFSDHHNKEAYWCHVNRGEATNRKCLFNSFALSGRGAILCVSLVFGSSPVFLLCTLKGWKNLITHTERNHTESLHGFLTGYNTGCECVHSHTPWGRIEDKNNLHNPWEIAHVWQWQTQSGHESVSVSTVGFFHCCHIDLVTFALALRKVTRAVFAFGMWRAHRLVLA